MLSTEIESQRLPLNVQICEMGHFQEISSDQVTSIMFILSLKIEVLQILQDEKRKKNICQAPEMHLGNEISM